MILAAGIGRRMQPLTHRIPKPLLKVRGTALIDYHLEALKAAGIDQVVINVHHLADVIIDHVGDGSKNGMQIRYSREQELLETAGGIKQALPMLGDRAFIVLSGDIFTDYDLARLIELDVHAAHLVMVDNPPHHQGGDFSVDEDGMLSHGGHKLTYAGIGLYHPDFFEGASGKIQKLRELLDPAIEARQISGEYHGGFWSDVGTIERFNELNR